MNTEDGTKEVLLYALKSILENSPDMAFIKDKNLHYVGASQIFADMAGLKSVEELIGKTDYDIFSAELAKLYTDADRAVLKSGISIINSIEPTPNKNGKKNYSSTSKYIIRNDRNEIIGIYGNGRDVTAQIELEEERELRAMSRQLFEDVLEADITRNMMQRAEGSMCIMALGLSKSSTFQETVEALASNFIHADYADEFRALYSADKLTSDYKKGQREFSHVTYQSNNGKNYRWMEFKSQLYYSNITNTLKITTYLKDLDDEVRTQEKLKKRAETDALTGLFNRESLMNQITNYLDGAIGSQSYALLFIDLDCFKSVNDTLGHPYGDKVLQEIANKLDILFRNEGIIGRIGGDEFLVFMPDAGSQQEIIEKANEVVAKAAFYQFSNETEIRVTCSVGVTMHKGHGRNAAQLYKEADLAMYQAKQSGKNRVAFYSS